MVLILFFIVLVSAEAPVLCRLIQNTKSGSTGNNPPSIISASCDNNCYCPTIDSNCQKEIDNKCSKFKSLNLKCNTDYKYFIKRPRIARDDGSILRDEYNDNKIIYWWDDINEKDYKKYVPKEYEIKVLKISGKSETDFFKESITYDFNNEVYSDDKKEIVCSLIKKISETLEYQRCRNSIIYRINTDYNKKVNVQINIAEDLAPGGAGAGVETITGSGIAVQCPPKEMDFIIAILLHELNHVTIQKYLENPNFDEEEPHLISEGLAVDIESSKRKCRFLKEFLELREGNKLIPYKDLFQKGDVFLNTKEDTTKVYSEGYILVDLLLKSEEYSCKGYEKLLKTWQKTKKKLNENQNIERVWLEQLKTDYNIKDWNDLINKINDNLNKQLGTGKTVDEKIKNGCNICTCKERGVNIK